MNPLELVNRFYTSGEIIRLTGITGRQLRYWDSIDFFSPSHKSSRRRIYSFTDLIQLTVISMLLKKGTTLQKIKKGMEKMQEILPAVAMPFIELQIVTDGESIFVHHKDTWIEAHTGQYMISFKVEDIILDIHRMMEEIEIGPDNKVRKQAGKKEIPSERIGT